MYKSQKMTNKQLIFKKRPNGFPPKDTWELVTTEVPTPKEGEIVVKQHYISLDPAMRGWMDDRKSYIPPVGIGEVMRAGTVGEVVASNGHPHFKVGDYLSGWGGVQQYTVGNDYNYFKVDPSLAPLETYISTLGMPGMTAYFGILEVGQIKEGETVLVSAASGAVGSVVSQIAKIKGCRVVGIAGGAKKCSYLMDELGLDGAIDYKNENLHKAIKTHCPKGIDVFFDNVGNPTLDVALANIRKNARIVLCGAISQYNNRESIQGPSNYLSLLINTARMEGIVVLDYASRYMEAAMQMGQWMHTGKLKSKEDVYEGIENFYETYERLFNGDKLGKLVLKVLE